MKHFPGLSPQPVDLSALLPPGYKPKPDSSDNDSESKTNIPSNLPPPSVSETPSTTAKPSGGFKVVFPSRPGGGTRKSATRTTTKSYNNDEPAKPTSPTILKGWPSR